MKRVHQKLLAIAASMLVGAAFAGTAAADNSSNFGMVAYWGDVASTYGGQIPHGAYVVVNPNSGALDMNQRQIDNYKAVIANIRAQGGKVLGYIPTGYNHNTADEQARYGAIERNVRAYRDTLGNVDGYFFDEAAFDEAGIDEQASCDGTSLKWNAIRNTLSTLGERDAVKVWNSGWPGRNGCFIGAARSGEHAMLYEAGYAEYANAASWLNGPVQDLANANGVNTWLLIHSADQSQMRQVLQGSRANYVYVTSVPYNAGLPWGGPIWNYTPSYWGNASTGGTERGCLQNLKDGGSC